MYALRRSVDDCLLEAIQLSYDMQMRAGYTLRVLLLTITTSHRKRESSAKTRASKPTPHLRRFIVLDSIKFLEHFRQHHGKSFFSVVGFASNTVRSRTCQKHRPYSSLLSIHPSRCPRLSAPSCIMAGHTWSWKGYIRNFKEWLRRCASWFRQHRGPQASVVKHYMTAELMGRCSLVLSRALRTFTGPAGRSMRDTWKLTTSS